jgi:hypothetical protein
MSMFQVYARVIALLAPEKSLADDEAEPEAA